MNLAPSEHGAVPRANSRLACFNWTQSFRVDSGDRPVPGDIISLVLVLAAIVGLFAEIPIVSNYAFWVVAAAYLVIVGYTKP